MFPFLFLSSLCFLTPFHQQEPPNLLDSGDAPDLPRRPTARSSPPPTSSSPSPRADLEAQKAALAEYEAKQQALIASREAEQRRLEQDALNQQREFEEQSRLQKERERLAQEELMRQQQIMQQQQGQMMNSGRLAELEREILSMRGQWERDQMMLERYDGVSFSLCFPLRLIKRQWLILSVLVVLAS